MQLLTEIIQSAHLDAPDGRPLCCYPLSGEQQERLRALLQLRVASRQPLAGTAAAFVLWSAEHIRANFAGGQLTWEFVFRGLGLSEDRPFGVDLVERGLRWWKRRLRVSEAGIRMFLYSLMAEGGVPEVLLQQEGLHARVLRGLLLEIEAEGGAALIPSAILEIATRRIAALPQTFHTEDTARILGDLALALAELRSELPDDVPLDIADRWLDQYRPGWAATLPLRLSKTAAEALIRPTLRAERSALKTAGGVIAKRLLRRDALGAWQEMIKFADAGALIGGQIPGAVGLRLRLLPHGTLTNLAGGLVYSAAPDESNWTLRRLGESGVKLFALPLDHPFSLAAFADGRPFGEVEIAPALPAPDEAPSFWRALDAADGDKAAELETLSGAPRTRAQCLWLLTAAGEVPDASQGLVLEGPEPVADACLWRFTGQGELRLSARRWHVQTGADQDAPEVKLMAIGEALPNWRSQQSGALVYRGAPDIWGSIGDGRPRRLQGHSLQRSEGRGLWSKIYDWNEKETSLARLKLVSVPKSAVISMRETAPGSVNLRVEGLPAGLALRFLAGKAEVRGVTTEAAEQLSLTIEGSPPGLAYLRISDRRTGAALELVAPWPARKGMILRPDGTRVTRDTPLAAEALRGWRGILPAMVPGDLQLRLTGYDPISVPVAGEIAFAAYLPLIMSMLSQGGPDAQVNLRLVVSGEEGARLELRRYQEQAIVHNGVLRLGLKRDVPVNELTALGELLGRAEVSLHAVDLSDPDHVETCEFEATTSIDLRSHLPSTSGPWLIQSRLDGQPQRAVVWAPHPTPPTTRDARIAKYAEAWRQLLEEPGDPNWKRLWTLIHAVGGGGDAGVSDQVQALALVPDAVVALALRVRIDDLTEALAVETAAPIFWPAIEVSNFAAALKAERNRLGASYSQIFDPVEASHEADRALARRIGAILNLRPELAGHFGAAMTAIELPPFALRGREQDAPIPLRETRPAERLFELAEEAVKRFDRLPSGLRGLAPRFRPSVLAFNPYAQSLIDAPLVAAEIAVGISPSPSKSALIKLINLRVVDPIYFDAALPAAVSYAMISKEPAQ